MSPEAYLIKEGECSVQSKRNPLTIIKKPVLGGVKNIDIVLRTKRGFLSETINTFQFGKLEKHQWVGAE